VSYEPRASSYEPWLETPQLVLATPVGLSTLVVEIPERPVSLLTDMGAFHFVRLAPHFGQDDKSGR
jgi:hypothetical protein